MDVGRGAHSVLARLAFGAQRFAYAAWVCSLFPRAVKRGADACAVGGDAYAAALNGEVRVFCFPTVACGVVGEERGAQVAVKHGVQRNRFDCFLLIVVIAGFSICFGLFDPCGGDRLTVFDCFRCSGRNTTANVFALFPDVAELRREVGSLDFVADSDGGSPCVRSFSS